MKKIVIFLSCLFLFFGCATTATTPVVVCEEPVPLRVEFDERGNALVWADEDCDGYCDSASIVDVTTFEVEYIMSCEAANEVMRIYEEKIKDRDGI